MTAKEILGELKTMSTESTKKVLANHGAPVNQYGVKVGDMKKIQKRIKKDYQLSLELYDSGIPDAQYLAGLIADESRMTRKDLQHWVENATWHMLSEYTVPWIAAESKYGWELGLKWIDAGKETIQSSGWCTLASVVSIRPDEELDITHLRVLLKRIEKEMQTAPNRIKFTMNVFLIAAGGYVQALSPEAQRIGKSLGALSINMGNTVCNVPYAPDYIQKMLDRGIKKKKMARC
jgi:3-methyladenine DNA glycosylase AlkD